MKRNALGLAILLVSLFALPGSRVWAAELSQPARTAPATSAPVGAAQAWTVTWGGSGDEKAGRVAVDGAGNVFLAGEFSGTADFNPSPTASDVHSSNSGSIDAFLSKFDADGNLLWAKTWGSSRRDVAYGVAVDSLGYSYVVGPFMDTVDFNPDPAISELHTSNAISGTIYHNNIYLSKFAPDGAFVWVRTWGPAYVTGAAGGAEGYMVAIDGNALYVVGDFSGGTTDFNPWGGHDYHTNHPSVSGPTFFDAFLSKFDLDGNFQWAKTWGGEGYDDGPGVAIDSSGNVYVSGMYASQTINFDPAGGSQGLGHPAQDSGILVDVFLSKFDADGNFQWVRTWGGQGAEDAMGLAVVDSADNIYVAGRFMSTNCDFNPGGIPDLHSTHGGQDAFVSKFDASGNFQWARTWGGSDSDNVMSLALDEWGNVYTSGWFSGSFDFNPGSAVDTHAANGGRDMFLTQYAPNGNYQWTRTWGGSSDDSGVIGLSGSGRLYAAGAFAASVDFDPGPDSELHLANGATDAFLSQFVLLPRAQYLPALNRSGP